MQNYESPLEKFCPQIILLLYKMAESTSNSIYFSAFNDGRMKNRLYIYFFLSKLQQYILCKRIIQNAVSKITLIQQSFP